MRDEALERIRAARLTRLETIEEQIAQLGEAYSPPNLLTERSQLRETLGIVEAADPTIDDEARRELRSRDQRELNINVLANLVRRVSTIEEWLAYDRSQRADRQQLMNWWMVSLTLLIVAQLLIAAWR